MDCICSSDLSRAVEIEAPTESVDSSGYGDATPSWASIGRMRAQIKTVGSREVYRAQQTYATTSHTVTLRYSRLSAAITAKHRVKYDGRYLNITGVENLDERNRWVRLFCTEAI